MKEKLLYKGKVKDVYDLNDKLKFKFSNRISVFDQIIPSEIKVKGEVLCRIAKFWFEKVEDKKICKTHFIDNTCKNDEMIVKKTKVIPLEFIVRHYNAGSYYKRHKGKYGEKLSEPVFEITTKFEKYDRLLTEDEALKISKLKKHDLEYIKEICLKIDEMIQEEIDKRGLIHVDGKKEFGLLDNEILLIDTFGTPDEDRFWDKNEYEKGN
ncbi:MAG: phosphoribosylaminoimidazolesuccinocarboxamide synthase, partial [Candidatus Pacearchaeota archaeon]